MARDAGAQGEGLADAQGGVRLRAGDLELVDGVRRPGELHADDGVGKLGGFVEPDEELPGLELLVRHEIRAQRRPIGSLGPFRRHLAVDPDREERIMALDVVPGEEAEVVVRRAHQHHVRIGCGPEHPRQVGQGNALELHRPPELQILLGPHGQPRPMEELGVADGPVCFPVLKPAQDGQRRLGRHGVPLRPQGRDEEQHDEDGGDVAGEFHAVFHEAPHLGKRVF